MPPWQRSSERRLQEYQQNKESGEGFGRLPDLILLDGGKGQISAVRPVLERAGVDIPLFGMVKDDKHKTRAIAKDGGEISILSKRKGVHTCFYHTRRSASFCNSATTDKSVKEIHCKPN